ncbi:hypothetical protein PPTG_17761 [Phytophthora nicotianae INRA-310]|uniref:Uncharacterized protein n=1 Tax=Phytophthora nicotianae (strain INRA-310) TaxID=761204 RepID=W2PJ51_PHYN3|nr:hypothetical protein PPTG_17761 [Phytophthora nicotianae INRA-310]ETN00877.1 hypothetical protein PPTG_17761 [Phytophthora nicotianae INRA-310]
MASTVSYASQTSTARVCRSRRDVKKMGEFNEPEWETMELVKVYMKDYNTCTLPHEEYYDIEKYEMKRYHKQQRKAYAKQKNASDITLFGYSGRRRPCVARAPGSTREEGGILSRTAAHG